jgi:hypothetical protein
MIDTSRKSRWLGPVCALMIMNGAALAADSVRYSTYLGGSGAEYGKAIAVDAAGHAYVVGPTLSTDFPVLGGLGNNPNESRYPLDSFLSELGPDGSLLFSTYLVSGRPGGEYEDVVEDVAAGAGRVYATGWIYYGEDVEAFVWARGPGGDGYFTYLIGEARDQAFAIAADPVGNAYVTGFSNSRWFLSRMAPEGGSDFLVKLDPRGIPVYDRRLGFPIVAMAGDSMGQVTVASGGLISRLDPSGSSFVYSTPLRDGLVHSIVVDASGNAYVTGTTSSADFPTTAGALQTSLSGAQDMFLTKIDPAGHLVYSTYLGGSGDERPLALALDSTGGVYLASVTSSDDSPLLDPDNPGCRNGLVSRLDLRRSLIVGRACVSSLNGNSTIAISPDGAVHVTGATGGGLATVNAFQPFYAGEGDAFVTRIEINQPPVCSAAFASPATLWPFNGRLVPVSISGVTDPDGDPITLAATGIRQDEPLSRPGQPDALGIGTGFLQIRSDRSGKGDGRVYHIAFEASDGNGGICTGTATVCVPHDQGRGRTCGDDGPLFNSNGGTR